MLQYETGPLNGYALLWGKVWYLTYVEPPAYLDKFVLRVRQTVNFVCLHWLSENLVCPAVSFLLSAAEILHPVFSFHLRDY